MRRREFIAGLGAAGAYGAACAAQCTGTRRVAILQQVAETPAITALLAALRNELARLGWVEGHNLRIDPRFGNGDPDRMPANATELVGLAPDIIVASGTTMVRMVQQHTQTVPIVIFGASLDFRRRHAKLARSVANGFKDIKISQHQTVGADHGRNKNLPMNEQESVP